MKKKLIILSMILGFVLVACGSKEEVLISPEIDKELTMEEKKELAEAKEELEDFLKDEGYDDLEDAFNEGSEIDISDNEITPEELRQVLMDYLDNIPYDENLDTDNNLYGEYQIGDIILKPGESTYKEYMEMVQSSAISIDFADQVYINNNSKDFVSIKGDDEKYSDQGILVFNFEILLNGELHSKILNVYLYFAKDLNSTNDKGYCYLNDYIFVLAKPEWTIEMGMGGTEYYPCIHGYHGCLRPMYDGTYIGKTKQELVTLFQSEGFKLVERWKRNETNPIPFAEVEELSCEEYSSSYGDDYLYIRYSDTNHLSSIFEFKIIFDPMSEKSTKIESGNCYGISGIDLLF